MNKYVTDYLTSEVIKSLGARIQGVAGVFLESNSTQMSVYIQNNYKDLLSYDIEDPLNYIKQQIIFEINQIANTLLSEYNPLENVSLTINTNNTGEDTHIYGGKDTNTRSGSVTDAWSSMQGTQYNGVETNAHSQSDNSGTSFDDLTYSPINRNVTDSDKTTRGNITVDGSGNNTQTYNNVKEELEMGHHLTMQYGRNQAETKQGTNGLFPYQKLIEMEYYLRTKTNFFQTCVKLLVNSVSIGVYDYGD